MAIQIGKYQAEGPYTKTDDLKNMSGVYIILGKNCGSNTWNVIDIGESSAVRERIKGHDRVEQWKKTKHQELAVASIYTNAEKRMMIEKELRLQFNPPCGKR